MFWIGTVESDPGAITLPVTSPHILEGCPEGHKGRGHQGHTGGQKLGIGGGGSQGVQVHTFPHPLPAIGLVLVWVWVWVWAQHTVGVGSRKKGAKSGALVSEESYW